MNSDEEIVKRKLYYDGLRRVINDPVSKKLAKNVNEVLEDEETNEDLKETLRLWKEVFAPLCNAIVFIHNNRFLMDEKEYLEAFKDACEDGKVSDKQRRLLEKLRVMYEKPS